MQVISRCQLSAVTLSLVLSVLVPDSIRAQVFTKLTDSSNPIVADSGPAGYTGASWIDFDGDDDLDLFVGNTSLYRNDGGGIFVKLATNLGSGQAVVTGNGNSWADYDNDGDLDVYISSSFSFLYRNDGGGSFVRVTTGEIGNGSANRGWACAWADFNNDGYVDLTITHPAGFVPPANSPTLNHVYVNSGPPDFTFARLPGALSQGLQPYTVGTWSDFDQDGDQDYFIGTGPANGSTAPDFLFRNLLTESGQASFERITSSIIATDRQDGQVWNWIDYDNDGDLDAYLTNWGGPAGGIANRLYRNDGGRFGRPLAGAIASDAQISLSSVWGDFDNDGDLDCYVANDSGQQDKYYRNNGDGTFSSLANTLTVSLTRRGASAGDYDNDGDLDLLAVGPGANIALYRNDTDNGNRWLSVKCVGVISNAAAIGAKVRAKATIDGKAAWQLREIQAQNNFNGQNGLQAHFGLGDATSVDSVEVRWPSGVVDVLKDVSTNQLVTVTEGDNATSVGRAGGAVPAKFVLQQNYPNPFNPTTTISYEVARGGHVVLSIFNLLGERVVTLIDQDVPAGENSIAWNGRDSAGRSVSSGLYVYRMTAGSQVLTRKMLLLK